MKLLKNYDFTILYHPKKVNVVVDAFNRKERSIGSLDHFQVLTCLLARDVQTLANYFMMLEVSEKRGFLANA